MPARAPTGYNNAAPRAYRLKGCVNPGVIQPVALRARSLRTTAGHASLRVFPYSRACRAPARLFARLPASSSLSIFIAAAVPLCRGKGRFSFTTTGACLSRGTTAGRYRAPACCWLRETHTVAAASVAHLAPLLPTRR